ncbi:hypothetical protein ABZY16_07800 [Streptomyces sp. NPDC006553]|uniref:hypothetical protein n=1 Tax=Streptomyces sp. NPDC006553 TaxID=3157180 RepID=UPI0033B2FEAF
MTWEQFRALRLLTIGTFPYITVWRTVRGLEVPHPSTPPEPIVADAVEATYLANDLASLQKDLRVGTDEAPVTSNFVLLHHRHSGDLRSSVGAAAARYNRVVENLDRAGGELAHLLRCMVEGGIDAHVNQVETVYPGAADALRGLHRATPRTRRRHQRPLSHGSSSQAE